MRFLLPHVFVFLFIFHCSSWAKQEAPAALGPIPKEFQKHTEDLKIMATRIRKRIYNNNHKRLPDDLKKAVNFQQGTDTIAITISADDRGQLTFAVASNLKKLKEMKDYSSLKKLKYTRDFKPYVLQPKDYDVIRKEIKKKYPKAVIHVVETNDAPTNLNEMREPHAEMVLLKYQMIFLHPTKKLVAIGASKTACEFCYKEQENVNQVFNYEMEYEKRNGEGYTEGSKITNWLNPPDIGKLKKKDITRKPYSTESIEEIDFKKEHVNYTPCNDSRRASEKHKKKNENDNCKPTSSQNSRKVLFHMKQLMRGKNSKFVSRLMRTKIFTKNKERLMKRH